MSQVRHAQARSEFQTVVIAGLTLVYVSAVSSLGWVGRAVVEGNHMHTSQFVEIAQLLKHPEIEDYRELLSEQGAELRKSTMALWIDAGFNSIIWLVALWKLVGAVA